MKPLLTVLLLGGRLLFGDGLFIGMIVGVIIGTAIQAVAGRPKKGKP